MGEFGGECMVNSRLSLRLSSRMSLRVSKWVSS